MPQVPRRPLLALFAVTALLGLLAASAAASPHLGRWEGRTASGAGVAFLVGRTASGETVAVDGVVLTKGSNPTGWRASVEYVPSAQNRTAGSIQGNVTRPYCDGQRTEFSW